MRNLVQITLAGVLFLLSVQTGHANGHRPPDPAHTREVFLNSKDDGEYTAKLVYETELISIEGELFADAEEETLHFRGNYKTKQPLQDGVKLAFQVYSKYGNMVLLDGERTAFMASEEGLTADFDYRYRLGNLKIPVDHREFYIRFNYVKEGEYWADIKYPKMELPSFFVKGLEGRETFTPILSYFPTLIPENRPSYSLHLFQSEKSTDTPFKHRATSEVRYVKDGSIDDNPRYEIQSDHKGKKWHFSLMAFQLNKTGRVHRRLGFVWDGVQWYPQEKERFKTSYSLSIGLYLLANAIATLVPTLLLLLARTAKTKKRKTALYAGALLSGIVLLAEFPNLNTPLFAAGYLAVLAGHKILFKQRALYWILLAYVIVNEAIWGYIVPVGPTELAPVVLSIAIAGIALAPITLLKRRWTKLAAGNLALVAIGSFYATMAIYYLFFDDYPSLNVLTYASQATDLLDSIASYFDSRFSVFAVACAFGFLTVNVAAAKKPPSKDYREHA